MMKAKLLGLLMILLAPHALAQALPARSIELFCAKKANTAGAAMGDIFGACVDAERSSLGDLKDNWTDYSSQSRAQCLENFGAGGLYSDLEACIEAAEAVHYKGGK
jgi:hypothetical protein